jgi:hypothetical protein
VRRLVLLPLVCAAASGCTLLLSFDEPPDAAQAADLAAQDQSVADQSVPDLSLVDLACGSGCTTDGGWTMCCSNTCVDTSSDPNNCGACGQLCASGRCGITLPALAPAGWTFNGSAVPTDAGAVLTPISPGELGTVFYNDRLPVDDLTVTFEFRISPGGSGTCDGGVTGDGMAFAIQTSGANQLGGPRGNFGVVGLGGYAVELDTFDDTGCDQPIDHVAIDRIDAPCNSGQPVMLATFLNSMSPKQHWLADCKLHTGQVTIKNGMMSVLVDGAPAVSLQLPGLADGGYWVGFGAGTGTEYSRQQVSNVTVSFPAPRCL